MVCKRSPSPLLWPPSSLPSPPLAPPPHQPLSPALSRLIFVPPRSTIHTLCVLDPNRNFLAGSYRAASASHHSVESTRWAWTNALPVGQSMRHAVPALQPPPTLAEGEPETVTRVGMAGQRCPFLLPLPLTHIGIDGRTF